MDNKRAEFHAVVDDIKNDGFLEYILTFVKLAKGVWDYPTPPSMRKGGKKA